MRNSFANAFYDLAKNDPRIYLVAADIGAAAGVLTFIQEHPKRFINVGVAEQVMIGFAAGLAMRGKRPFAYTIAPFTIYRPFEQVRVDLCYQNLPVKLVGVGGGVNYSMLGSTHHSQEDIAVMGALPNMTIVAPCDPLEAGLMTKSIMDIPGPVYFRLGKVGEPVLSDKAPEPFVLGKIRKLKEGEKTAILTYGPITRKAFEIANALESRESGGVAIYNVHSIKPIDQEGLKRIFSLHQKVIIIEEQAPHGGLNSIVKTWAYDHDVRIPVKSFTLKDEFIHTYGTHDDLLAAHGLSTSHILENLYSFYP